jgi:hypothetical protein
MIAGNLTILDREPFVNSLVNQLVNQLIIQLISWPVSR